MKLTLASVLSWLALPFLLFAENPQASEVLLIEQKDHLNNVSWSVMTPAEFTTYEKALAAESRFFDKALGLAAKQWASTGSSGDKFPAEKIHERRARIKSTYEAAAKAEERRAALESKARKKERLTLKKVIRKWKRQGLDKEDIVERQRQLNAEKAVLVTAARMVENKLSDLLTPPDPPEPVPPAPAAAGA